MFYKDPETLEVYLFDSEADRKKYGKPSFVLMTSSEIEAHLSNRQNIPSVSSVTRAQGKAALIRTGLWQGVRDFVESIEDETEKAVAEVALNDTTHWQRTSPFLKSAAQSLGLTEQQLDDLFIQASKIEL